MFCFDFLMDGAYIQVMDVITIPRGDFVIIPRKEYEAFSEWKKALRIRVVRPTKSEAAAIRQGRREIKEGKYVEWKRLKQELARRTR